MMVGSVSYGAVVIQTSAVTCLIGASPRPESATQFRVDPVRTLYIQ